MNNAEVAQALLDAKADPAARTEKKMFGPGTALQISVNHDRASVRGLLLSEFLQRDEWAGRLETFARSASERLGRSMLRTLESLPGGSNAFLVEVLTACGLLAALPESAFSHLRASSDVLLAYFGHLCAAVAWQVNPLSEEKVCVSEATVHIVTEHLPGRGFRHGGSVAPGMELREVEDAPDVSPSAKKLNGSLRASFPVGVPSRLLVIGSGGSGKTLLTQQILLESCRASLDGLGFSPSVIPFRVSLSSLVPLFDELQSAHAWEMVTRYFAEEGSGGDDVEIVDSVQVRVVQRVSAEAVPALLVADGLDEVQGRNLRETMRRRRMVLTWIGKFDSSPICVVVTSRPAGIDGRFQEAKSPKITRKHFFLQQKTSFICFYFKVIFRDAS